ncbi:hypothetical protein FHG87_015265 [Trinorchestia longiramus]|nr:hypothetical protein FHG87_015265 [Trinorchestia longiramus]
MGKNKDISQDLREHIVELHNVGLGYRKISAQLCVPIAWEWPSQSPDMNPIKNVWRELKLKIQKRGPNNITELKVICVEEWNKIMPETCERLVVNYYKRLETIINNKGYATKY